MSSHLNLFRRMMYVFKSFPNLISFVTVRMMKLIYLIFRSYHLLSLLHSFVIIMLKLTFIPLNFSLKLDKMFKPLRIPSHLHPYPPNFVEYLPLFTGEGHVTTKKHLESFHNFIDNFEIVCEDIVMAIFSKSLDGDVGF